MTASAIRRVFYLYLTVALNSLQPVQSASEIELPENSLALIETYCLDCHDSLTQKADLDLEPLLDQPLHAHLDTWEKVILRLSTAQMPPPEKSQPTDDERKSALQSLTNQIDEEYFRNPDPGRTETFRRLNRFEYQNAIRDLLGLETDMSAMLPHEESSHGFDNVTVSNLSPTLLDRYISAAGKIARMAVGNVSSAPIAETIRIRPDISQEKHVPGLPLGTRGGTVIPFNFPASGEYEIRVLLTRDRNEHVEGLYEKHQMDILLDRSPIDSFEIEPPPGRQDFTHVDDHLVTRAQIPAGRHELGVTFPAKSFSLQETRRQPFDAHFNMHRHPRLSPAVFQVTITGPLSDAEQAPTPSRNKIFTETPESPDQFNEAAERILSRIARKAWRRPVSITEMERIMDFFQDGLSESNNFDQGIERALSAVLVNPEFIFRIERQPDGLNPGDAYPVSRLELASRLSFFLWSSLPDEALLEAAVSGQLDSPEGRKLQVLRMLQDPRSSSLVTSFASQWLYLRNLDSIVPDLRLFPDFDDNLRQAFREETQLFISDIIRNDESVVNLLKSDFTYLNERLATHYDIPGIYGSRFRKVQLDNTSGRGGILRQGSILMVTSYATRTSPVLRGNWILENILGTPAPPPPPNVPSLDNTPISESLPIRQRLQRHREDPTCASCHNLMDPVGFALENYDAVGRWRTHINGQAIDSSGAMPDGSTLFGVADLEDGLLKRPDNFVYTLTHKLLTYALGRGIDHHDAPAIRRIVREAAQHDFQFSAIISGIVESIPFQMRKAL